MLERLRGAAYVAEFGVGLDACTVLVDDYFAPIRAKDVRRLKLGRGDIS
jgi:hypothetical protein